MIISDFVENISKKSKLSLNILTNSLIFNLQIQYMHVVANIQSRPRSNNAKKFKLVYSITSSVRRKNIHKLSVFLSITKTSLVECLK